MWLTFEQKASLSELVCKQGRSLSPRRGRRCGSYVRSRLSLSQAHRYSQTFSAQVPGYEGILELDDLRATSTSEGQAGAASTTQTTATGESCVTVKAASSG